MRGQGNSHYITNMYYNKNAGNPNAWLYVPDLTRQAFNDKTWQNASGRITAQITPRNKVNVFWDEQSVCASCENGGNYANATTSPEANGYGDLHADALPAGDVDLAGEQQAAARGRLRLLLLALGRPRQGGPEHREPACASSSSAPRGLRRPTATSPA